MGRYISIDFHFEQTETLTQAFYPLFAGSFFRPTSLGGRCGTVNGQHWFLNGRAIENFISFWAGTSNKMLSVEVDASPDALEYSYLQSRIKDLQAGRYPQPDESPFEIIDIPAGTTFLPGGGLDLSVLERYEQWAAKYFPANKYVRLNGTVELAVSRLDELPWNRAYRYLFSEEARGTRNSIGPALLFADVDNDAYEPGITKLCVYSQAEVWLEGSEALNGLVGPKEANTNLSRLVALVGSIMHSPPLPLQSIEIYADGRFYLEKPRLDAAFAPLGLTILHQ